MNNGPIDVQIWEFDIWAEMRPLAELLANRTANDSNLVYSGVDQMVDDDLSLIHI